MKPKHTHKTKVRVYSVYSKKGIRVDGYRITKHFAVTRCVENSKLWSVTHLKSGTKAISHIKNRRLAEIVCVVLQSLPMDWNLLDEWGKHDGTSYTGRGSTEIKQFSFLGQWLQAIAEPL